MTILTTIFLASGLSHAESELWAGHQVVYGKQTILVLGEVKTRTDSFVLAEVTREGNTLTLQQKACDMDIKEVLGVKASMDPSVLGVLPDATIRFAIGDDGSVQAAPWVVGWGEADLDGDGHPGATIDVANRVCGGEMYVSSSSKTAASGLQLTDDGLTGQVFVKVTQNILGASRACLRMGSDTQVEEQQGQMAYRRVPPGTSCADLSAALWPVRADAN